MEREFKVGETIFFKTEEELKKNDWNWLYKYDYLFGMAYVINKVIRYSDDKVQYYVLEGLGGDYTFVPNWFDLNKRLIRNMFETEE